MLVLGPLTWKLVTRGQVIVTPGADMSHVTCDAHLVEVTLAQEMLQYPSSCLMQAV